MGAEAPEQDGGASAERRQSGLGRQLSAAGRPLQPPARALVSSAALSGSGRGGAAAGRRARVPGTSLRPGPAALPLGRASRSAGRRDRGLGRRGWASRSLGEVGVPACRAGRAQGHGGNDARRRSHVRAPRVPGLRDPDPARPGAVAGRRAHG